MTTPDLPSIASVERRLRAEIAACGVHGCERCAAHTSTIRMLAELRELLEDADVEWTDRTTEHEATLRALLAEEHTNHKETP